jgi:2-isopropylmalate synthase
LLLANLHYKNIRPLLPSSNLREVSQAVGQQMGSMADEHRPVIGEKVFQHIADLHVKAMKKDSNSYNWIDPELLGHQTDFPDKLTIVGENAI